MNSLDVAELVVIYCCMEFSLCYKLLTTPRIFIVRVWAARAKDEAGGDEARERYRRSGRSRARC